MSKASEVMERLLQGERVEWKPLGVVLERTKGISITASKMRELHSEDGEIKVFAGGNTSALFSKSSIKKENVLTEPSIIVKSRGNIDFEFYDKPFTHKNELWSYCSKNPQINIKFVYYFLKTKVGHFQRLGEVMQMPQISTRDTDRYDIPIPPLHVQEKIVSILDTFTELTKELTKEQQARQTQYEYYRDKLLTFEDGEVEWKTLDECFEIIAGGDVPREALSETYAEEFPVPVLSNGIEENSIYGWTNRARITEPSLTISARGTIGWTSIRYKPFFPIVRLLVLTPKREQKLSLRYAYYYMKAIENSYKLPSSGIPQLTRPMIRGIKIPIPPLHIQQEIVDKLDRFNALANSITEGLPREIELRQQQYEYYRDLLLDFPNAA